jgi:short-subunit dehydrogenase
LYIRCDITDVDAVNKAADQIRKHFGSPSILVNNAGIGDGAPVLEINPDFLKKIVGVNMMSHFYTCAAFGPDMVKANKGHIVTVASMASFISVAATADYAATKAGVLAFHEGESLHIASAKVLLTLLCVPEQA